VSHLGHSLLDGGQIEDFDVIEPGDQGSERSDFLEYGEGIFDIVCPPVAAADFANGCAWIVVAT